MASIQAKKVPNNQIKKFLIFLLFGSLMFLCGFYTHSEYKNVLEIMDDIKVNQNHFTLKLLLLALGWGSEGRAFKPRQEPSGNL